ncbi:Serine/threonine-protein kinase S6KL [Gryllus bimaculatus]|nr:Serine/threonine-protein kinase S6KL [Gryllus bimaculatus]
MGNSNQKTVLNGRINQKSSHRSPQTYSSQFSLSNFLPNISGRSYASGVSQHSTYSVSRPWSRVSRRRWHERTLNDPLVAAKTAWPVPYIEAIFLPEFKIKGDVSEEDFEYVDLISKGAFGTVYKVQKVDTGEEYALKVLSKSLLISQNAVEQVKDEVRIQSMCGHHPFIVNSPFFWQNKKKLFIVSEFIPGGELLQLCQLYGQLPENLVRVYVAEIALALDFLHNAGVIYRDLKLENILLDQDYHLQLIDFGLAKWLKYVDWWSLGIVMCCMLSGEFQPKEILLQHFPDGPPHSLDPESLDGFDDFPTAEHSTISFR